MGKIAVKVGVVFTLLPQSQVQHIQLREAGITVRVNGMEYIVFSGSSFEESVKVDKLMDTGNYPIYNLSEYAL